MNRPKQFTIDELLALYAAGPDVMCNAFIDLLASQNVLFDQIATLTVQVQELQSRVNKDSHNSSKPPSSDGYSKPTRPLNLRGKSGKKSGGQHGHSGYTLERVSNPDYTFNYVPETCGSCGFSLTGAEIVRTDIRQVFDLPPLKLDVTEHKVVTCKCPHCRSINQGKFPDNVRQPTQYGPGFLGLLTYLNQYQFVPLARTQECVEDLFGHRPSQATIVNAVATCARALVPIELEIKGAITKSQVVNFDETGTRSENKLNWIHSASTPKLTFFCSHEKRGKDAIDAIGILKSYFGNAVHDCWASYLNPEYKCVHSLCNAHLLREMLGIWERTHQTWTQRMSALLCGLKRAKEAAQLAGKSKLDDKLLDRYRQTYSKIVAKGMGKNAQPESTGRPGRPKNGKTLSLLLRLNKYAELVLRFAMDFSVPFDNNLAERDLRMIKLKQKISGCFRNDHGMKHFCTIRGYISTLRKQALNSMAGLRSTFDGKPITPSLTSI